VAFRAVCLLVIAMDSTTKLKKHPCAILQQHCHGWRDACMKLNKNDEKVVAALKANKELTLAELAEKTELPSKKAFRSLKKLFENEMIDSQGRKYKLLSEKPPAGKDSDEAEAEEE